MSMSVTVSGASAHSAIPEVDVTWTSMTVSSCADLVSTVARVSTVWTRSHAAVRSVTAAPSVSSAVSPPTDAETALNPTVPITSPKTLRRRRPPWTVVRRRASTALRVSTLTMISCGFAAYVDVGSVVDCVAYKSSNDVIRSTVLRRRRPSARRPRSTSRRVPLSLSCLTLAASTRNRV